MLTPILTKTSLKLLHGHVRRMSRARFLENTRSGFCTTISYPLWLVKWHTRGPRQPKLFRHLLLFWMKHLLFYASTMCTRRRCTDFGGKRASSVHGRVVVNLLLSPKASTQAKNKEKVLRIQQSSRGGPLMHLHSMRISTVPLQRLETQRREEPLSLSFYSTNRNACH